MNSARRWAPLLAVAVTTLAAAAGVLALITSPASAFPTWDHQSVLGTSLACATCHTTTGAPTDSACTGCHTGFKSVPGYNCWSCHTPGVSTAGLSSPSSACSQSCHLWNEVDRTYDISFTHGTNPHLGSTAQCLDCHSTSTSGTNPGASPHHSGQATGFTQCGVCHSSQQKHAGQVACTSCHTDAAAFHTYTASSPGFKKCGDCHTMKHAGVKVPASKCASCHQGSGGRQVQHSATIGKKYVCSACHSKPLHASALSHAVKSCRTCHGGKYHARQVIPSRSVCAGCHSSALHHADGFQCTLCHLRAVHNARPSAIN